MDEILRFTLNWGWFKSSVTRPLNRLTPYSEIQTAKRGCNCYGYFVKVYRFDSYVGACTDSPIGKGNP